MRKFVAFLCVPVALLSIQTSAHAYSGNLAPSSAASTYTAYYDGAYGPFYNGYWTAGDEYYFSTGPGKPFARDEQRHFRRAMITGYHPVEGFGPDLIATRSAAPALAGR